MDHEDKMRQIDREAKASGLAALAIILFWIVAGFGVSRLDITVFHFPLWAITGCIGTWLFAIALSVWLVARVFRNFDWEKTGQQRDGASSQSCNRVEDRNHE